MYDIDKFPLGRIMTLSGNVGNGKNTFAVSMIRLLSKICSHGVKLKEHCKLCDKYGIFGANRLSRFYANFPIDFKGTLKANVEGEEIEIEIGFFNDILGFLKIPFSLKHGVIIFDEPNAQGFDSRTSGSLENRAYSYKFQHIRHYNCDVLLLPQFWSQEDLRGRRLSKGTLIAIEPSRTQFRFGYYVNDDIQPIALNKQYAKNKLFPYFSTTHIVGEEAMEELIQGLEEDKLERKKQNEEGRKVAQELVIS